MRRFAIICSHMTDPTPLDIINIPELRHDAGKVRTAIAQSAGTLAGVNPKSLLTDIRNERSQKNTHRPF